MSFKKHIITTTDFAKYIAGKGKQILLSTISTMGTDLYKLAKDIVKSKFIYRVCVTPLLSSTDLDILRRYFKRLVILRGTDRRDGREDFVDTRTLGSNFYDITIYNKTPIVLYHPGEGLGFDTEYYLITPYKESFCKNLDLLVEELKESGKVFWNRSKKRPYMMPEEGGYRLKIQYGFPKRSFKDTFITDECENKLKDSIRSFLKNREWYEKHNIPYHFGIILYGEPGTGKSSVVQAVLNEFNFTKIIIPARYLRNGLEQVNESRSDTESTLGIVVEDIDLSRTVANRDADYDYQKDRDLSSLVELMNSMDGIGCLQNVIYIFTTNNISGIDKALLRPGRLDLHMNISYACDETFDKFLKFHYGKGLPDEIHISDEVIFAQVQTDVMSGLSYEEVIEKYRRKEG